MSDTTTTLEEVLDLSESLSPDEQLRLIGIVSERLRQRVTLGQGGIDMRGLAGLGAEVWRKIDVDVYLDEERDSWER